MSPSALRPAAAKGRLASSPISGSENGLETTGVSEDSPTKFIWSSPTSLASPAINSCAVSDVGLRSCGELPPVEKECPSEEASNGGT